MTEKSGTVHVCELFESALQAYEKKAGVTLAEHPLAVQLQSCDSVESTIILLQGQAQAFIKSRGDRAMKPIKNIVSSLTRLSATPTLAIAVDVVRQRVILACFTALTAFTAIPTCESNPRWSRYPTCCMCPSPVHL